MCTTYAEKAFALGKSPDLAIDAAGLAKSYATAVVLGGIDLRVPRASVYALLGPNGAGKTTAVRILSTLLKPDGGRAAVAGFDVVGDRAEVRRRISLTGQQVALDELRTGTENLRTIGALRGLSRRAARRRAGELLAGFGLSDAAERRVSTYSGGMRRRLDLAASLVVEPEVLFLDEPTTGLDPRSRLELWDALAGLVRRGVTIFLTTQYLEEADRLADRIGFLADGRVVAEGTAAELKSRVGGHRLALRAVDRAAFELLGARLGERAHRRDAGTRTLSVPTDGSAREARALLDALDPDRALVERFSLESSTLDDVFLALTGDATDRRRETGPLDG
jgi:ABC-2 type transport system ATP-binding protein